MRAPYFYAFYSTTNHETRKRNSRKNPKKRRQFINYSQRKSVMTLTRFVTASPPLTAGQVLFDLTYGNALRSVTIIMLMRDITQRKITETFQDAGTRTRREAPAAPLRSKHTSRRKRMRRNDAESIKKIEMISSRKTCFHTKMNKKSGALRTEVRNAPKRISDASSRQVVKFPVRRRGRFLRSWSRRASSRRQACA